MIRLLAVAGIVLAVAGCGASAAHADLAVVGCVAQPPAAPRTCGTGLGLFDPRAVAVDAHAGVVYAAGEGSAAVAVLRRSAEARLAFARCISDDGTDGRFGEDGACADGDGLGTPVSVVADPGGRHVYVAGRTSRTIATISRDPIAEALAPAGCLADRGRGRCGDAVALGAPRDLALSPDGRHLYLAGDGADAVHAFARDGASGALTQIACISDSGTDGMCADGGPLRGPEAVAVSPDGAHVYVAARTSGAIAIFSRDASTGALRQIGCVLDHAPAGPCSRAVGLSAVNDLAFTGGGRLFATAGSGAVTSFARDATTGALRQLACASSERERGCSRLEGLDGAAAVASAPDGRLVVAARGAEVVHELDADPATGALTRRSCIAGFLIVGCAESDVVREPTDVAIAADGRVYVAAAGAEAIAELAPAPAVAARRVRVRGPVAAIPVRCPAATPTRCGGRLVLQRRSRGRVRVIGSARFRLARGTVRRVDVRVRRVTAPSRPRVRVSASLHDGRTRGRGVDLVLDARKHR